MAVLVLALEAGDDDDVAGVEVLVHFLRRDVHDLRLGVHLVGDDAGLRAGERHGRDRRRRAGARARERDGLLLAVARRTSISRAAASGLTLACELDQASVTPDMAETTMTSLWPSLRAPRRGWQHCGCVGIADRCAAVFLDNKGHGEPEGIAGLGWEDNLKEGRGWPAKIAKNTKDKKGRGVCF